MHRCVEQEEGEKLEVVHFHYLEWRDMTAELSPESMAEFVAVVRQHVRPDKPEPMLVHCRYDPLLSSVRWRTKTT